MIKEKTLGLIHREVKIFIDTGPGRDRYARIGNPPLLGLGLGLGLRLGLRLGLGLGLGLGVGLGLARGGARSASR